MKINNVQKLSEIGHNHRDNTYNVTDYYHEFCMEMLFVRSQMGDKASEIVNDLKLLCPIESMYLPVDPHVKRNGMRNSYPEQFYTHFVHMCS